MNILRRLSSTASTALSPSRPASTASSIKAVPPGPPRRLITFVYGRESYDPLERRLDRAHSHFELSDEEQAATGLPRTLGYGPRNPEERETLEPREVEFTPSQHAQTGPVRGKVWTRLYQGRDLTTPDPAAGAGIKVELGKLTEEGAENLRRFVDGFDNSHFDVTGVQADNCAQFSLKVAQHGLGLDIEAEDGRQDTSGSAGAKIEAAAEKMRASTSRDRYPYLQKPDQ